MSFPNVPHVTPMISLTTAQTVPLLLASIAFEELGLAHMINAEAEKLQFVLGTLKDSDTHLDTNKVSISNILDVNTSVQKTLKDIIKKEMLLEFKFENILELLAITSVISPITPPPFACNCSAHMNFQKGDVTLSIPGFGDATGHISLTGDICPNCGPAGSSFIFDFDSSTFPESFTSNTITSVTCDLNKVTVTGSGSGDFNGTAFTSTFTLTLDTTAAPNVKFTLIINNTPNGTQTIDFNQNGNGHLKITGCPTV